MGETVDGWPINHWRIEDLDHASRLAAHLRAGGALQPLPSHIALTAGEFAVADLPVCVKAFVGTDVEYRTLHNRAPHPVGVAVHLLVNMPLNELSRQRAAREAAPRWRPWISGRCVVTTRRILVDDGLRVRSWWFNGLARTQVEPGGLILLYHEGNPAMMDAGRPWYLAVLVYYLAWHQVIDVPAAMPEQPPPAARGRFRRS